MAQKTYKDIEAEAERRFGKKASREKFEFRRAQQAAAGRVLLDARHVGAQGQAQALRGHLHGPHRRGPAACRRRVQAGQLEGRVGDPGTLGGGSSCVACETD